MRRAPSCRRSRPLSKSSQNGNEPEIEAVSIAIEYLIFIAKEVAGPAARERFRIELTISNDERSVDEQVLHSHTRLIGRSYVARFCTISGSKTVMSASIST